MPYALEGVKVERPDSGDHARGMGPFLHDDPHPRNLASSYP